MICGREKRKKLGVGRSDSVWAKLRNQPIYSPPQSPSSSVFLISPQLYFSLPPPLTPQLHFSPPPPPPIRCCWNHSQLLRLQSNAAEMRQLCSEMEHIFFELWRLWHLKLINAVSKTDCILLEPQGEKDVSPTCSKIIIDGQTERENEMIGHLEDQNEGPNFLNTENGSNEESITTPIFHDSVPVSEMDCILLEPEGEKNMSPICKTPIVEIVLDFIEGPNLSNIENHSNEKSIMTPTFQDSVPGNYRAMNLSIHLLTKKVQKQGLSLN